MKAAMLGDAKKLIDTLQELRFKAERLHEILHGEGYAYDGEAKISFKDANNHTNYLNLPLRDVQEIAMQALARQVWATIDSLTNLGVEVPALPEWFPRRHSRPSDERMEEILRAEYRAVECTLLVHTNDLGRTEEYIASGIYNAMLDLQARPLHDSEVDEIVDHENHWALGELEGYIDWAAHHPEKEEEDGNTNDS